jgi:hypothetical protein
MTTQVSGSVLSRRKSPKPYSKPTLAKGPLLSDVAAIPHSPPPPCWVARAAFGEGDIRWMIFRAWLLEDAPEWFRRLYLRHGERFGGWLRGRPVARALMRLPMMFVVRSKLRG